MFKNFLIYYIFFSYQIFIVLIYLSKACVCAKLLQLYLTPYNPVDCSPAASSVHGILQARILEWVAVPSSKGSSHRGIKPTSLMSPAMAGRLFITRATWEAQVMSHRQLGALGLHETGSDLSVQG